MEEQEVLRLFGLFTGLSEEEAAGWAVLCRSTIAELTGRLRPGVDPASAANRERLSAAAAAMAAYRYRLLGAGQTPDSLKVGEITLTSGGSSGRNRRCRRTPAGVSGSGAGTGGHRSILLRKGEKPWRLK